MNKVYLNEDGKVFINGNEVKNVSSVSTKTTWTGTEIIIALNGDFKSDFQVKEKAHTLGECAKE